MKRYNPKDIEPKWQQTWLEQKTYEVNEDSSKPKKYIIDMFPYPSGAAMHVGHVRNFTISDVLSQFHRQKGYNVMHTMGWDTFGLPAENYAIKTGKAPAETTKVNIANFKHQLQSLGMSYDWSREVNTSDPEYYRWTQWIFIQLFEKGLAYQKESPQWWCPHDKTVLANEQVEAGRCWRCGNAVVKKSLKQWFFKITDYADALLAGIDDLDWPEKIKTMQRNWIGKSMGAEITFEIPLQHTTRSNIPVRDTLKFTPKLTADILRGDKRSTIRYEAKELHEGDYAQLLTRFNATDVQAFAVARITNVQTMTLKDIPLRMDGHASYRDEAEKLADFQKYYGEGVQPTSEFTIYDFELMSRTASIFTTRPDTIFGATFLVLAPEHPLAGQITSDEHRGAVETYQTETQRKSEIERQEGKEKTGVFTGAYAINPLNNQKIPIWIADYVLMNYGTGAIMAVPAHDERDYAFAVAFDLPVVPVVAPAYGDNASYGPAVQDRQVVNVILHDPKTDKYCVLDWRDGAPRKAEGIDIPGGGIDDGETVEQAALRETREETGYTDVRITKIIPAAVAIYYVDSYDDGNTQLRRAIKQIVIAELVSDTNNNLVDVEAYEKDQYDVRWLTRQEIALTPVREGIRVFFDLALDKTIHIGEGVLINSGAYDNLTTSDARERIVADLTKRVSGHEQTNYKIRDWLISRQRYWGVPIPIIHCPTHGAVAVPEQDLPVVLPQVTSFEPTDGDSVLAGVTAWVNTTCPTCGGPAKRETDTMDGYACSSWYFLRYTDPHNDHQAWDPAKANHWLPVDYYCGGDHAVSHLLYSRFWMHFFADQGWIEKTRREPVGKLVYNGYILSYDGQKMSKSKGNVINPDDLIAQGYGADSVRLFEMFIAPYEQNTNWNTNGVPGTFRFLQRIWTLTQEFDDLNARIGEQQPYATQLLRLTHHSIKKVTNDLENLSFNTAVAALMEFVNALFKIKAKDHYANRHEWRFALESLLQLLAPFAPHMSEELWQQLGHQNSIHFGTWPQHDEAYLVTERMTIVVQINGKLRAQLELSSNATETEVIAAAMTDSRIMAYITGQTVKRTIYIPRKVVNIVL